MTSRILQEPRVKPLLERQSDDREDLWLKPWYNVTGPPGRPHVTAEETIKTTSRPRGRRHTAKASCSVPWAVATQRLNTHRLPHNQKRCFYQSCWAAAEPSAQPDASGIKAKHLQTASFWQVPFRREPWADRDASSTVNPQPESGEQVTQRRAPAPLLVSGVHTQLISSVADGEHHTASGDGDRRRGPYDSTVQWLWDKTTTIPPPTPLQHWYWQY